MNVDIVYYFQQPNLVWFFGTTGIPLLVYQIFFFGPIAGIQHPCLSLYPLIHTHTYINIYIYIYIYKGTRRASFWCGSFNNYLCNINFWIYISFYFASSCMSSSENLEYEDNQHHEWLCQ